MSNYYQQFRSNKSRIDELKLLIENDPEEKYREEYQQLIEKNQELFNTIVNKIELQINRVLNSIMQEENLNYKAEILEIEKDFSILREIANQILDDIKSLKNSFNGEFNNIEPIETKNSIKDLRKKIRDLKQTQIIKYNDKINVINERIKDIRRLIITDDSLEEEIKELEYLHPCDIIISKYDQRNYLDILNYDKLRLITYRLDSIENKAHSRKINKTEENIKIDVSLLLNKLKEFNKLANEATTIDDVNKLLKDINSYKIISLVYFRQKLEKNKNNISNEFYNQCLTDISKINSILLEIEKRLDTKKVKNDGYQQLTTKVDMLCSSVEVTINNINGWCYGNITTETALFLIFELDKLTKQIIAMQAEIDTFKFSEINQKSSLKNKLEKCLLDIEKIRPKIKEKTIPIVKIMTASELKQELDLIYEMFKNDYVISDTDKRQEIGKRLKKVKQELDICLDKTLITGEYANINSYFEQVNNEYLAKCPRVIKQVKSAENVYKKHNKTILIASGLSIMALSFASNASRLLIPAIILGNMIIAEKDEMIEKINSILAKMIKAKQNENGVWIKEIDGAEINSDNITTILLKSVAVTGKNFVSYIQDSIKKIKILSEKISLWDHIAKLKTHGKHEIGGNIHGR